MGRAEREKIKDEREKGKAGETPAGRCEREAAGFYGYLPASLSTFLFTHLSTPVLGQQGFIHAFGVENHVHYLAHGPVAAGGRGGVCRGGLDL